MKRLFSFLVVFVFFSNSFSYAEQSKALSDIYKKRKFNKIILGPKLGISMSGFSNYGLQAYYCEVQYGFLTLFKLNNNFGIQLELNYARMGTKDSPLPIHIGINTDATETKKNTQNEEEQNDMKDVMSEYGKEALKLGKKLFIFKREEITKIHYITLPVHFLIIFKSHENSYITNHFHFGFQISYAFKGNILRYEPPSMIFNKDNPKENIYWTWTKCKNCEKEIDIMDKINKFDYGLSLGYSFESDTGFIFGLRYYEGFKKVYKADENTYMKQRKNISIEFYLSYNFLSFIKY